jgi:hypothetical protein
VSDEMLNEPTLKHGVSYKLGWCEWPECDRRAEADVHARWSMFDFIHFRTCGDHLDLFSEWLWKRHINGAPPEYVTWDWYDP